MRYAITGATGLLGGNLAGHLAGEGHEVIATKRGSSKTSHLDEFDIDWVDASLDDVDSLARAFDGADVVFHCAAAVSVQYEVRPWIYAANVNGTKNVLDAVRQSGAKRLVHCSTVGAIGPSTDGTPCDETQTWNNDQFGLADAYTSTKYESQKLVLEAAKDDVDAVVVNPGYMIGPYDARPSSGELVVQIVKRKIPGYPPGRNTFVDVRDVVRGMAAAAEKGRRGELYIMAGHNIPYREFFDLVSHLAGTRPISFPAPQFAATVLGWAGDLYSKATGNEPLLNSATVRWSTTNGFIFSSEKAQRELGYEISPLEPAIQSALDWFRAHDML